MFKTVNKQLPEYISEIFGFINGADNVLTTIQGF